MPRPSEFDLIARLFAPLATAPGAFGLKDDAAIIAPRPGHDLVVTTDTLVEGVHFLADDPPDLLARKALRVNLSDLAAKGAEPAGYLLALSLPANIEMDWLESFAQGLAQDQQEFSLSLIGGDTTATPGPLSIAITAFGHVPEGTMLRRNGARAGDSVFVSGNIGDGGGGLAVLQGEGEKLSLEQRAALMARYRLPEPRLALGQALRGLASASLDVSDGLLADLGHIAETSQVRLVVREVPRSPALLALWGNDVVRAATAGDDYEIAFTAPPERESAIFAAARRTKTRVTKIGSVEAGDAVVLLDAQGKAIPVSRAGYTHF